MTCLFFLFVRFSVACTSSDVTVTLASALDYEAEPIVKTEILLIQDEFEDLPNTTSTSVLTVTVLVCTERPKKNVTILTRPQKNKYLLH